MATKQTIQVDVQTNLAEAVKLSERLKDNLQAAAAIRIPIAVQAAQQGVTNTKKMATAQPTGAGSMASDTNLSRGISGETGASGRDFAKQAQGLGGLVHVYATFAANLFAVSAAFTALSKAADTTNMIKGLDQLGAASGRALGTLSKKMVEAADGALSLREAMQSTAIATAGGMTSDAILRMTDVAKKASAVLGRDMSDSMDRLTKGIVKIQPELLDELGIMTRVIPAQEAYARKLGKTISSLTDFEKRQAFANAVLTEGEAKFGDLGAISANPYDKLLASLKNVAQQGLELINKVLTPIINILSSSPTALVSVLSILGMSLIKQALPAIGQFKAGLAQAASEAGDLAAKKAQDATLARSAVTKQIAAEADKRAQVEIDALDRAEKDWKALQSTKITGIKQESAMNKMLQKDIDDISSKELNRLKATSQGMRTKGLLAEADAYDKIITQVEKAKKAQDDYFDKVKADTAAASKAPTSGRSIYKLTLDAAYEAQVSATKKGLVSNAAYNASLIGIRGAFVLLNAEIAASGIALTAYEQKMLKFRAGIAAVTGVISALGETISKVFFWIGIITTVFSVLDGVLSKNSKNLDAFSSAMDDVEASTANAERTLARLDKLGGFASASISGINAMSNAMLELANSAEKAIDTFNKANAGNSLSWFDNIKNKVKSLFGGGIEKDLAAGLTTSIQKSLTILTKAGLAKTTKADFARILGIESFDTDTLNKALLNLSDTARVELSEAMLRAGTTIGETSARLQDFKTAADVNRKSFEEFIQSTANTNPMFKLGLTIQGLAKTMDAVSKGSVAEITAAFEDMAKAPEKYAMFGTDFTNKLVDVKQGFLDQAAAVTVYQNRLNDLNAEIDAQSAKDKASATSKVEGLQASDVVESAAVAQLKRERDKVKSTIDLLPKDKIIAARDLFTEGLGISFKKSSELINIGLGQAAEKAAMTISKARAAGLTGERRAVEEGRLKAKELNIQMRQIDTSINLILSQEQLKAAVDLNTAQIAASAVGANPAVVGPKLAAAALYKYMLETAMVPKSARKGQPGVEQLGPETYSGPESAATKLKLLSLKSMIAPQVAAKVEVGGEESANVVATGIAKERGKAEDKSREIEQSTKLVSLASEDLAFKTSAIGISLRQNVIEDYNLKSKTLANKQEKESFEQTTAINIAKLTGTQQEIDIAEATKKLYDDTIHVKERDLLVKEKYVALVNNELERLTRVKELEGSISNTLFEREKIALDKDQLALDTATTMYGLSEAYNKSMSNKLDLAKVDVDLQQKLEESARTRNTLQDEYAAKISTPEITLEDIQALNEEYTRKLTIESNSLLVLKETNALSKARLLDQKAINEQQEKYNNMLSVSVNFAESMKDAFGTVGDSLGKMVTSFTENAIASEKSRKAIELSEKSYKEQVAAGKDASETGKETAKLRAKQYRDDLTNNIALISGVKSLFKEKSLGYKVLGAVEKSMHVARIAMDVKEFLTKMGFLQAEVVGTVAGETTMTAASITGSAMKAIGSIPAVLMKFMEMLGPWGMAAGAAAVAMALSGGTSTTGVQGPSAQERQDVQGSAMGYNDQGKLVQKSSGVFGDTTAKSESIANSLEIIKNNSIVGLDYDNKMLRALESLAKALDTTSRSLYKIPGLVSGSVTGLQEGVNTSGGFLGIGGLFSSTVTKNIVDSGLKLAGTFASLAKGASGTIKLYEDIKTVVQDSGFFGLGASTSTSYATKLTGLETLNPQAQKAIADAFNYGQDLLYGIGKLANVSESIITSKLSTLQINELVSLRGLKGDEFNKALSSVLSSIFDQAAEAVFTSFKTFAKFGEGMLETVVRVVDANNKLDQALRSIGSSFSILGKFNISETMISLAGSLSDFMDQAAYFRDSFLSEQEKLVPIQAGVSKELARLGVSTDITKDQYKALVLAQDLSTKAGQTMYQSLMDLAPGFVAMTDALETINNTVEKTTKRLDLEKQIYEALGNSEKVLAMTRQAEIDSLKELDASLVPMQLYLNALQDEATLKGKLTTAYTNESNAIKSTITSLKAASKTITDYRTNLLKSTASILTPAEKYAQTKLTLLQTAALATSVITANSTAEDIAARDAAIGQVSSAADAFLASSKEMFASSDQYTKDFSTVLDVLDTSATNLSDQQTTAELQLTALDKSVSALDLIKVSTDTTATLLDSMYKLQKETELARLGAVSAGSTAATTGIPQFANGGYASGVSIVGEHGPEVVDFKTPGRVYSNRASNDLFNTKELCAEIKSLREEVNQLRKDQHQQTGNIIAANYDANNKNADQVVEGTEDAIMQQQWQLRNQVKVA